MKPTDTITSGPIIRAVFSLALPVVLGMIMEIALSVVNFFWVGKLGAAAQDAITSSMVVHWAVFSTISVVVIGITALVSRHIGAREPEKASFYVTQAMWLAIALALIISVAGLTFAEPLLRFMKTGPETMALALPYLQIFFLTPIFFAIFDTIAATFRAAGDTKTPTIVAAATIAIDIILNPLLLFGIGPFPEMGVPGAAVATFVAICTAMIVSLWLLIRGKAGFHVPRIFSTRPDFGSILKIAKIGTPIATQQLTFIIVYWFLIRIVHEFGESAGAAMGIGNRMESLSYLTCSGFAMAASTMVGQNIGAGKPDRAAKCAWFASGAAVAISTVIGAFFVAIPGVIVSIFTNDPSVHAIATDYLIILGLSQMTMAIEIVIEGAFAGAGDTVPPMLVMIPGAIVRVPLAYFLAFNLGWGINGIWWTLTITTTIKATVLAIWFRRGGWKLRKL
jgi:putative MATE family efflux protein